VSFCLPELVKLNATDTGSSKPTRRKHLSSVDPKYIESIALNADTASIGIVIASRGRPDVLSETIHSLQLQTVKPEKIIVVVPSQQDLPAKPSEDNVDYLVGHHGLTLQRNKGIEAIPNTIKYVGCLDDDIELRANYLEEAVTFLDANVSVIGISGQLLANGGISRQDARELIASYQPKGDSPRGRFFSKGKHHILHGCNMVIRRAVLNYETFDENLPFYSYGEDYDISVRLERYGLIGKFEGCIGVHLATPGGRVRELLRGYSFVANNWYFMQKGVMHLPVFLAWLRFLLIILGKNMIVSFWNLLKGDRSLDWSGRLKGHLLALTDIFAGRCHPERIKQL
jgi:GT2 family glycosyltransferase